MKLEITINKWILICITVAVWSGVLLSIIRGHECKKVIAVNEPTSTIDTPPDIIDGNHYDLEDLQGYVPLPHNDIDQEESIPPAEYPTLPADARIRICTSYPYTHDNIPQDERIFFYSPEGKIRSVTAVHFHHNSIIQE